LTCSASSKEIPVETTTTEQYEPRAMLALIALTELPLPKTVAFHPNGKILSLTFERLAPGQAWSAHLGGQTETYDNRDGHRYLNEGLIKWHGWTVQLHASEPIDSEPVDSPLSPDVTARLTAVARA